MSDQAEAVPLVELLRVPEDARGQYPMFDSDGNRYGTHMIPFGHHMNLAADEITRLQAQLNEASEKLNKVVHCVSDLIDNSDGVYGLHLNGDPSPWNSLLKGGRDEGWMIDFSEVAYTAIPPTNKGADSEHN